MYRKVLLPLLCVALLCTAVHAAGGKWIGGASGDWNNAANWSGSGDVYSEAIRADFTTAQLALMDAFADSFTGGTKEQALAVAQGCPSPAGWTQQVIDTWAADGTIAVGNMNWSNRESCAYTVLNIRTDMTTDDFYLTDTTYGATTINQSAGNVTAGQLRVPRAYNGVYNITGGTLTANQIRMPRRGLEYGCMFADTQADGGVGDAVTLDGKTPMEFAKSELNILGGTVTTPWLDINNGKNPAGIVRIGPGGKLILTGDQLADTNALIANGNIVGIGCSIVVSLIGGNTIIIPEPATMLMLGLGAMGLIRRKK